MNNKFTHENLKRRISPVLPKDIVFSMDSRGIEALKIGQHRLSYHCGEYLYQDVTLSPHKAYKLIVELWYLYWAVSRVGSLIRKIEKITGEYNGKN
jgi:hypothetical protein